LVWQEGKKLKKKIEKLKKNERRKMSQQDPKVVGIQKIIDEVKRAAVVTNDNIKEKSTTTTYRSAERIISSNDLSGFGCYSHEDFVLLSAIVHRKQHAQTHFLTKIHLPLNQLSTQAKVWCSCPFSSPNLWCSHAVSIMMLVSQAQLGNLRIQPSFDAKVWRPKPGHALYKLPFVRETCLPWEERLYIMISTEPSAAPERRHASLVQDRVPQTYLLEKEKSKKRGRSSTSSLISSNQKKTTSWSTALQHARNPIVDTLCEISHDHEPPVEENSQQDIPLQSSEEISQQVIRDSQSEDLQPETAHENISFLATDLQPTHPSSLSLICPQPSQLSQTFTSLPQEQDMDAVLPLSNLTSKGSLSRLFRESLAGSEFGRGMRQRKTPRRD
jgi:hypothetical protein